MAVCIRRLAIAAALAFLAVASLTSPAQSGRRFEDAADWAEAFDNPGRDQWQKPADVLRALQLGPDMTVADIGAGTGYFTVRLARALPGGKVFAVDTEPAMVAHLRDRVRREKLGNVEVVRAERGGAAMPAPLDLALLVNVQGLVARPRNYFADLRSQLKPGGRVAIIATRPEASRGVRAELRVPAEQVKKDMALQGYELAAEHDFLERQYFLIFRPAS